MADQDENGRAGKAREHARLRATLGEEPGSGYAFHDEGLVERMRSTTPRRPQGASTPRPSVTSRKALVHASARPERHVPEAASELATGPDPQPPEESHVRDKPLFPGRARPGFKGPDATLDVDIPASDTPRPARASVRPAAPKASVPEPSGHTPPSGAAIWHALPSVLGPDVSKAQNDALQAFLDTPHMGFEAPQRAPSQEIPTVPLRSRPPTELAPSRHGLSPDARLARIEPLVARSAWDQVLVELTTERDLSPALSLIRQIARREVDPKSDAQHRHAATAEATSAVAALLGVAATSPLALVMAKRLLRKNPRGLRERHASAGVSTGFILAGIVIGVSLGFVLTRIIL